MTNEIARKPSVLVMMATYNGEKYIRQQLDSILQQTYPIHEIIINDDISTDKTVDIIKEYMIRHDNIHLFVNSKRLGAHPNFMVALETLWTCFTVLMQRPSTFLRSQIKMTIGCPISLERQLRQLVQLARALACITVTCAMLMST